MTDWLQNGNLLIDGTEYTLKIFGTPGKGKICPVRWCPVGEAKGKQAVTYPANRHQSDSSGVDDLFQKSQPIETTTPPIMKQNFETKKGRGRPRKTDEMSRVTAWRRKKEEQVRML